ncbi:hypothetical protein [Sphingomonas profundi]|uniref:hypothetical protein n=1 Tax=Alterirhizorhabdus profundi TaxID=2681549 RepID=UPI0012E6FA67|nr:hypothetical protein [Sphingomonas profundi]
MVDQCTDPISRAVTLMRQTINLLDQEGAGLATSHLQIAIDMAESSGCRRPNDHARDRQELS